MTRLITRVLPALVAGLAVAVAAACVGASAALAADNVVAPSYRVEVEVLPDGSLDVTERIVLAVGAKPITWFERAVPTKRTDGLSLQSAEMDGRATPVVETGPGLHVSSGRQLKLRWEFAATANTQHEFLLRYRALHVVAPDIEGPHFTWNALPSDRTYAIAQAAVSFRAPLTARAKAVTPKGGAIAPAGSDGGLVVEGHDIPKNRTISVAVTFEPGSLPVADPQWFIAEDRALEMAPAWLAGAASMLAVSIGILIMIGVRLKRPKDLLAQAADIGVNESLPPAIASRLIARGRASVLAPHAALFRLVRDGVLVIEKTGAGGRLSAPTFTLRPGVAGMMAPHEEWVFERVGASMDLKAFGHLLLRRGREFQRLLRGEMTQLGLIDEERVRTNDGLRTSGFVILVFGMLLLVGTAVFATAKYDTWPIAIPLVIIATGLMYVVASAGRSELTDAGLRESVAWQRHLAELRAQMKAQAKGAASDLTLDDFNQGLPFAVGAGIGSAWIKAFRSMLDASTDATLDWLRTIGSAADASASLDAIIVASGAHAAHGGGAGGAAGAAGGGSSGAG